VAIGCVVEREKELQGEITYATARTYKHRKESSQVVNKTRERVIIFLSPAPQTR
jgi:hypothetical protein